jgi:4-nitrophenyl phosphatase
MTWKEMAEAAYAIARGVPFIGTNIDASFPTPRGLAPGNGAILAALETTTGITPITVGKPNPFIFQAALAKVGTKAEQTLVVGDRLETDIAGGNNAGCQTALVLTGVTREKDLMNSTIKPTYVFNDLSQLRRDLLEG